MIEHLVIQLSNIHCEDCEVIVHRIFSRFFKLVDYETSEETSTETRANKESGPSDEANTLVNIVDMVPQSGGSALYKLSRNRIDVYRKDHDYDSTVMLEHVIKRIIRQLQKAGFDVLSWEYYHDTQLVHSSSDKQLSSTPNVFSEFPDIFSTISDRYKTYKQKRLQQQHVKNCTKCQMSNQSDESFDESVETIVDQLDQEFRAVFSVGGMTCVTCVQAVGDAIQQVLDGLNIKSKDDEPNYSVNLIQHSAVVIVPNKQIINKIVDAIYDIGFDCNLLEVLPVERSINIKLTAAIEGMSCSSCANSINSAVEELSFVLDCNINFVTKTGVFLMEQSDENIKILKETVESCGYGFEVLSSTKINYALGKKQSRSINLTFKGMYCSHCPQVVYDYLNSLGHALVIEEKEKLTLSHPYIRFTYYPNQETGLTIRRILEDLNHIRSSNDKDAGYTVDHSQAGQFACELVTPISTDEHLHKMAKREVMKVFIRLVIATVLVIPMFIFGVVAPMLLPKSHSFRVWVDEPLWTGNVARKTWILFFLSTPVYFFAADVFHRSALLELRFLWVHKNSWKKRILKFGSMNLLVCLGTSVAYFASIVLLILSSQQESHLDHAFETTYFDSVGFLTFFLLIGRLLESISKNKTANAVIGLGTLKTTSATLVDRVRVSEENEGNEEDSHEHKYENDRTVDVKYLEVGDFIRISTGQSPPVDCVIVENSAEFDESAITGESTPVKHEPGHQIFSGTVNVSNKSIIAKILSLESDSLIDQILSTVREGQMRKAPIERVADTLTGYFVPVIVVIAVLVLVIWLSLSYSGSLPEHYLDIDIGGWFMWSLEFSISVFVIACPCGIGLAAPTALFVGSGLAAKYGILVKGGGSAFQDGAGTKVVCFDKTGTLTYGQLKVSNLAFNVSDKSLQAVGLQLTRDLELGSQHPLAHAIRLYINESTNLSNNKIPAVETIAGKGLKGLVVVDSESREDPIWTKLRDAQAILGNESLFRDYNVTLSDKEQELLHQWKTQRKSVVLVGIKSTSYFDDEDYHVLTMLGCRDQIRGETRSVITYLQQKLGIECWMITGDNSLTANAIGAETGIRPENIVSEVLPNDKQTQIQRIKAMKPKNVVAMVGDGINDAPALATADLGIALSSGADLAVTSSDFILLNTLHPLSTLVTLFDVAKTVFRRVKFNFAWALIYNMVGIPIAAGVIYPYHNSRLGPAWASAAMAASSVSVVLSSLALNWYKPKIKVEEFRDEFEEEVQKTVIA